MPDATNPIVLVLASSENQQQQRLVEALANLGRRSVVCSQVAQAYVRLARRDVPEGIIGVVIVLDSISGLPVAALAKSLRALPGRSELPLILVDAQAIALPRTLVIRETIAVEELAYQAVQSPAQWPTAPEPAAVNAPAAPALAGHSSPATVVFDPTPILVADRGSPGVARQLVAILQEQIARADSDFQNHLSAGSMEQLGKVAHKLRGAAGSLGATEFFQLTTALEQAARKGDTAACTKTVAEAKAAIDRLRSALTDFIASLAA